LQKLKSIKKAFIIANLIKNKFKGSALRQLISKTYEEEMFKLDVNTDPDI